MRQFYLLSLFLTACFIGRAGYSQNLKPGFDKEEYIELLKIYSRWGDSTFYAGIAQSETYTRAYGSPTVGLENRWELHVNKAHSVAVISIRGTTADPVSWLANFYAAMVPAKGSIQLTHNLNFNYQLATNPRAAVHAGWLISLGFLANDILPRLDSCYRAGIKEYIILGHSQGGAIAYLLTSHLYNLQDTGKLPADIRFKTYCSAGPKPGNLYYAYEYESRTQGGWAFNVVNSADWVPEFPISIQTVNDFNLTNPFINAKAGIKKQKFPRRAALHYVYKQLTKHTLKAQKRYQQYLGTKASKFVKSQLKEIQIPTYYNSNHYVRTGAFIVLLADEAYYQQFPESKTKVFTHHMLQPYYYLAQKLK
ncbi:lipase family protein [Adhaeribacter radiodurans]|uniref:Lipase family protein n=1 Tax=Adhaeribacter radiodurans TaxID=2745197 RepID=A0A7L7LAA2_9BACT|nr:lipase family protein [Adhaeribacter radiodurans]QMU29750.1 lipase family protein [Adhaeribacter radiodurans]